MKLDDMAFDELLEALIIACCLARREEVSKLRTEIILRWERVANGPKS